MRLLNTTKLTLHTFFDELVPKYAILSHRWDEEEVTLQDLQNGRGPDLPGFAKIEGCCAQARSDGWEYTWIDSCCIDKSSSAELSEAINSMFKWYEKAMVCYVYLSDVDSKEAIPQQLEVSAWFTRGWTLQELLAPETVVFFDRHWRDIGTKSSLEDLIKQITRIRDIFAWQECCVAEKMSWASRRGTTRVEDEAYCLMGLFDVNMPLLYGEGMKAFQRLQLEILNSIDDDSLFCWEDLDGFGSMLALSPAAFERGYWIRHYPGRDPALSSNVRDPEQDTRAYFNRKAHPTTLSNKGLHLSLCLIPTLALTNTAELFFPATYIDEDTYVVILQGLLYGVDQIRSPVIVVKRLIDEFAPDEDSSDWNCTRVVSHKIFALDLEQTKRNCQMINVRQSPFELARITEAGEIKERHSASRLVYVKAVSGPFPLTRSSYDRKLQYDIFVHASSLRTNSFEISRKVQLYGGKDEEVSSGQSESESLAGPLKLKFESFLGQLQLRHIQIYFKNHTTKETLLFLVFGEISGRVSLALLTLNTNQRVNLPLQLGGKAIETTGMDRVSVRMIDGSIVSASIRRAGGSQDIIQYSADIVVDISGTNFWPPSKRHSDLSDYVAHKLTESNEAL